ncbi:MAG: tetratricopeptide repeat protein [Candidatus Amoebophilus sp.]
MYSNYKLIQQLMTQLLLVIFFLESCNTNPAIQPDNKEITTPSIHLIPQPTDANTSILIEGSDSVVTPQNLLDTVQITTNTQVSYVQGGSLNLLAEEKELEVEVDQEEEIAMFHGQKISLRQNTVKGSIIEDGKKGIFDQYVQLQVAYQKVEEALRNTLVEKAHACKKLKEQRETSQKLELELLKKQYKIAADIYQESANQGYAEAQNNLGWMYHNGLGLNKDYTQALAWYQKAADQGYAEAQCNLGDMYYYGLGVCKNYTQALTWYQKAAGQDHAKAQHNLGWIYQKGLGVDKDYTQALAWYQKAADQGHAEAYYNLGWIYQNGLGIDKDYTQALAWYQKAADQGYTDAQNQIKFLTKQVCTNEGK